MGNNIGKYFQRRKKKYMFIRRNMFFSYIFSVFFFFFWYISIFFTFSLVYYIFSRFWSFCTSRMVHVKIRWKLENTSEFATKIKNCLLHNLCNTGAVHRHDVKSCFFISFFVYAFNVPRFISSLEVGNCCKWNYTDVTWHDIYLENEISRQDY